ncbi:Dynein regulatory complex protein 11 [Boothiomyces macroporosus]|uniref:Dynein regulatory complex protein 11 n=1 Tax=Boothiomyces macroporosus TaxID=261099 RepID=A0AAD5UHB0_9FUNG|nr:Dynein regulatory complex protein 11 [Boothiomyces macroporosus]
MELYENPEDPALQIKDQQVAFQHMAVLYIKYIQLYRRLEDAYDQLLHPQKRRLLKNALVACMGRLVEIKHILVDLECTDFNNLNDLLLDLNLTPDKLSIPVPRFLAEERMNNVLNIRNLLQSLNAKDFSFGSNVQLFPELTVLDAIKIIQINERGRQGNLRAKYMREIKEQAAKEKDLIGNDEQKDDYRGYRERVKVREERRKELVFLGMEKPEVAVKSDPLVVAKGNRSRRKLLQIQYEEDYLQALITTKDKILRMEGPDMKEAIQDDFRQWYMEYKRINGKFPEFPTQEVWQKPDFKFSVDKEPEAIPEADKAQGGKDGKKKGGDKKKAEKEKKSDKKGKGQQDEEEEDPLLRFKYGDSTYLTQLGTHHNEYATNWKNKDESENFAQKHDQEIIKADKRKEVETQIKMDVYDILADELKNLKLAVEKEGKGKKGKKGKGGKKGGKKGKKDKGKKGKKEKDLTANRTMDSLIEELVKAGLFQKVLVEYCGLPLGLPYSPELPPPKYPKIASVLLCGPSGVGKTMLVQALATELGANILNLSPRNTAGQYVGKLNVVRMVHMVFKVARQNAPSIIYIDGVEMIFAKKVPKDDTSDPKRIKKDLTKAIKLIRDHNEKVILIATTNKPWDGEAKAMLPLFDKILFCPKPDYGGRVIMWTEFINRLVPRGHESVNISLLARMSEGFSTGSIEICVLRVLTPRRIRTLRTRPLKTEEFVNQLLDMPPPNPDEAKLFRVIINSPLGLFRQDWVS